MGAIGFTAVKRWRHKHDARFADIETRLDEDRNRYAYFICSLRRIEGEVDLRGGWYNFG